MALITYSPDSPEGKRLIEEVNADIKAAKDYASKYGAKSTEGFYPTTKGPKGLDLE